MLDANKLNLMRQRMYIPVTDFSGLQQKAITVTGADLTDLDLNVMDDDSAATNGTPVYLALERGVTEQGMLWTESAGDATSLITSDTGSLSIPMIHKPIEDATIKVVDDDSASSNGTALYVVPIGEPNEWGAVEAQLMTIAAGNADTTFNSSSPTDSWTVWDIEDAVPPAAALALYFDDDGSTTDERFLVNNPTGADIYVKSIEGRHWQIKHDASAASNGTQVYYDDDGTATDKLLSTTAGDATVTTSVTGTADGFYALDGWYTVALYFDDDGATESERLVAAIAAAVDAQVFCTSGNRMVKVKYDASAASNGTRVYFDHDAAGGATERLLSVNAGNADSTVQLDPTYQIYDDEGGQTVGTVAADTIIVSAADNTAILEEVNSTGIMGLKMAAADLVNHLLLLPSDIDRKNPVYVRCIYTTGSATTTDGVTWVVTYIEVTPDDTAITGTINTALDTAIAEDLVSGQWDIQRTAAGVINDGQIADAALYLLLQVEMDATDASEDIFLLGLELEYSPRLTDSLTRKQEAPAWGP